MYVTYDFPFAWMCSRLRNSRHAPLLFLPLARETLRKEENQVYRVSTVLYTCVGKMKSYIVFLGKLNFCLEMEKQLRLFEIG